MAAPEVRKGIAVYLASITEPDALSAVRLTLIAAGISVPLNLAFGIAAAWAIAKFEFRVVKDVLVGIYDGLDTILSSPPFWVVALALAALERMGAKGWEKAYSS